MGQFSKQKDDTLLARCRLLLVFGMSTACAAASGDDKQAAVTLEGQRKFLNESIALCIERVPALKTGLTDARNHAEPQIRKAEGLIGDRIAATASRDQPLLARYIAVWNRNADELLKGLKLQNAEMACPTLRDNWLGIDADVLVEDWQNFLDRSLAEDGAGSEDHGGPA